MLGHRHMAGLVVALTLALAAFTGSALAGGGQGNGGGNGNGHDQQQAAPTQQQAAPTQPAHAHGSSSSSSSKQSSTSASNPATGGDNSQGVKPSSTTKHDTYAKASSDQTKQYGNGKTAGQIATQAGQPDATLHGPGNSQPHKTLCGGHEVDVHALKNKGSKCGAVAPAQETHAAKHEETHTTSTPTPAAPVTPSVVGQHATICHATGSATNPFVMISPSVSGVYHGHIGHQDGRDIIPPFTYGGQTYSQNWDANGQAIFNAGCTVPAASAAAAAAATVATTTTTEQQQTQATTTTTAATTTTIAAQIAAAQQTQTTAAATPVSAGAVQGATAVLKPKAASKPAGGVLGATTRLGGTVASTTLPFTGLPLWIFAAVAAALILAGAAVRRSANSRL